MQNFRLLMNIGVEYVNEIIAEIDANPQVWDMYPIRTALLAQIGGPNESISDILLQYTSMAAIKAGNTDPLETVSYPPKLILTKTNQCINALLAATNCERLGRSFISKMGPGKHISAHCDSHVFSKYYGRYHISLKDNDKTLFRCGDEYFAPKVGDIFYFDNSLEHEVWNDHESLERWTLVIDMKKPVLYTAAYEPVTFKDISFNGGLVTVTIGDSPVTVELPEKGTVDENALVQPVGSVPVVPVKKKRAKKKLPMPVTTIVSVENNNDK